MSEINQINVAKLFLLLGNQNVRNIIQVLQEKKALSYTKISLSINQNATRQGLTSYYLKKMVKLGLVRHDKKQKVWYLTRAAAQITNVIETFENYCTTYDMNDVNADGKVELFAKIIDRKQNNDTQSKIVDMMEKQKIEKIL